jgi:hypothetical protein
LKAPPSTTGTDQGTRRFHFRRAARRDPGAQAHAQFKGGGGFGYEAGKPAGIIGVSAPLQSPGRRWRKAWSLPVFKDLSSPGRLYCRRYGGRQMLVSKGLVGEKLAASIAEQGDVPLDHVVEIGEQVAQRFPAYVSAGLASSWTGVYDMTPDWNPVLGRLPGVALRNACYSIA